MKIGDRVILTTDIYEDEINGLIPAKYLAYKGDEVIIKALREDHEYPYSVAHDSVSESFRVKVDEIKVKE